MPPDDGHRRNLNRSVMFYLRLNPDEFAELQHFADERGLPARTLARAWILERMRAGGGHGKDDHADCLSQRAARLERALLDQSG